jgi:hypothetical protein
VIAEGNETPQTPRGEQPGGSEGRGWRGEGDLLAERRARRAAEAPEHLLTLRAEAAEATVRTLESHLATIQQRLRDAETETRRLQEALVAESRARESGGGGGETSGRAGLLERELQRARQREQAEHRARMEAEDRAHTIERDDRAEVDRLARRLSANVRYMRALAAQLQDLERRLLDAEERVRVADERARAAEASAADAEAHARAAEAEASAEVRARIAALEHTASEVGRGLERERTERERAERVLVSMRRGQRRVEGLVRDLGAIVSRLRTQVTHAPPPQAAEATPRPLPGAAELAARRAAARATPASRGQAAQRPDRVVELENALEAAVVRLRARADETAPPQPERTQGVATNGHERADAKEASARPAARAAPQQRAPRAPEPPAGGAAGQPIDGSARGAQGDASPAAQAPVRPQAGAAAAEASAAPRRASHKHSLSLIGRIRRARKQRRERR